jgi:hypothetical protein
VGALAASDSILDVTGEVWCFDTAALTWHMVASAGSWPEPRRCPGWVAAGDSVFLWGGSGVGSGTPRSVTFLNDFWRFDARAERWSCLEAGESPAATTVADGQERTCPGPRYCAALALAGSRMFLFGGYTEDATGRRQLDDAWVRGEDGWCRVRADQTADAAWPAPRYGSMAAADGEEVFICGGAGPGTDRMDLWRFGMTRLRWERLAGEGQGGGPEPRYCAAMAVHGGRVVLFGGRSRWQPTKSYNDLWLFDLQCREWTMIEGNRAPHRYGRDARSPGYHAKSAVARIGDYLYLLCGEGRHGHVSDFWRLDLRDLSWQMLQAARDDDPILW